MSTEPYHITREQFVRMFSGAMRHGNGEGMANLVLNILDETMTAQQQATPKPAEENQDADAYPRSTVMMANTLHEIMKWLRIAGEKADALAAQYGSESEDAFWTLNTNLGKVRNEIEAAYRRAVGY